MPSVSLGSTSYNVTIGYSPSLSAVQQAQGIEGPPGPTGDSYWVDANPGIYTTGNVAIGTDVVSTGSTALWVRGDVRITGILSVGQGTVTIDGNTNTVNVDNIIVGTTLTGPSGVGYATEGYVDNLVAISTFSGDYNDLSNQPSIPSIVGLASEGYVDTSIANLVDSAPETLDTLNELASALGDDPNFSTTILNSLGNKADLSGANFTGVVTATSFVGDGSNLTGISTFSGDYGDLTNTPTIPSDTGDLTNSVGFVTSSVVVGYATEGYVDTQVGLATAGLASETYVDNLVAISTFSGDYNDLTNQPTIPSDTGDLTNGAGYITSGSLVGYATEGYVDSAVAGVSTFSGDYGDLTNTPTIPSDTGDLTNSVGFVTSSIVVGYATEGYVDNLVAISTFSGDYNDLINTPTIPSDTGDLTNSVGFVTSSIVVGYATEGYVDNLVAISTFSGDYNDLINTPTTLSSFSNDVGFVTSSIVVGYATEGYVTQQIVNLVDGAPEALDTLNELAAALNDDENFATTVTNSLALKANIDNASFTGITTTQTLNVGIGGTIITTTGIGSVGIGTTNPTATLDVAGSIKVTDGINVTGIVTATTFVGNLSGQATSAQSSIAANTVLTTFNSNDSNQYISFTGGGGNQQNRVNTNLRYNPSQQLFGINTTNPTATLDVNGDANFNSGALYVDNNGIGIGTTAPSLPGATKADIRGPILIGQDTSKQLTIGGGSNGSINQKGGSITLYGGGTSGSEVGILNNSNIYLKPNTGGVELYYGKTDKKFETTGYGVTVSGGLNVSGVSTFQDNVYLGPNDSMYFGTTNPLRIFNNGSSGNQIYSSGYRLYIDSLFNDISLRTGLNGTVDGIRVKDRAAVELYHNGNKKFETTVIGATVFGTLETQQLNVSGVSTFQSNINVGTDVIYTDISNNAIGIFTSSPQSTGAIPQVDLRGKIVIGVDRQLSISGGSNGLISQKNGSLSVQGGGTSGPEIRLGNNGETYIKTNFGGVNLYYGRNDKKFETTVIGATVFGTLETQQLNVSGVSTFQGDTNVTGNLTVDTNTLFVNSTTNRIGIGSTQPTATLDVNGDVNITGIVTATSYTGSGVNLSGIVTSIVAGTNITISGSSGEVTINSSGGGGETISPFLLMGA